MGKQYTLKDGAQRAGINYHTFRGIVARHRLGGRFGRQRTVGDSDIAAARRIHERGAGRPKAE